ncbi:alpha/beta fold hydrolase [Chryseobacterium sp.]|uniref:alpha/beta fold hydrolase n=1 Tax=Chryseobacterium sp. TaxID=1871047 RepID=UPI00333F2BED
MKIFRFTFILLLISIILNGQTHLEKVKSFFPDSKELKKESIDWYRFSVPENWKKPDERKISLAVSVLKSKTKSQLEPVVFIQGGPGGNTIEGIRFWLSHPIRNTHDIILLDLRGTGFSQPQLCPDLGKKFFQILAKNQSDEQDIKDKVQVSLSCKQDMIDQGIDLGAYNSVSVAHDLHNLKNALKIPIWNVYGVSYGTFISQNYAKIYAQDVNTLTLDSSIPDISVYYTNNTQNYVSSLNKVFKSCKEDPNCQRQYPDLENIYYNTISELEANPITVNVDQSILPGGKFTYNVEDYKIAIQQGLYNKKLVEVLPLLIYQFKERNKESLSGLVQAFSGALSLNYGNYFCFTCNEVIPYNSLKDYDAISSRYTKLKGGLSFYRSDFNVCEEWNKNRSSIEPVISLKNNNPFKVLILSGSLDPITPDYFAQNTALNFANNVKIINGYTFGHALGYNESGAYCIRNFIEGKPNTAFITQNFDQKKIAFKTGIALNKGVVKTTGDINSKQWYYFIPLVISLLVILVVFIGTLVNVISQRGKSKLLVFLLLTTSGVIVFFLISLVIAISRVLHDNFYILAFGLPSEWSFIFVLYKIALALSIITFVASLMKVFRKNIPLYVMIFLAIGIFHFYFFGWL